MTPTLDVVVAPADIIFVNDFLLPFGFDNKGFFNVVDNFGGIFIYYIKNFLYNFYSYQSSSFFMKLA
jgi:hypothetical protein